MLPFLPNEKLRSLECRGLFYLLLKLFNFVSIFSSVNFDQINNNLHLFP